MPSILPLAKFGATGNFLTMERDASEYDEASITPDMASQCDTLADHVAEMVANEVAPLAAASATALCLRVIERMLREERFGSLIDVGQISGRDALARCIALILQAKQPRLMARCIDLVFQLGQGNGISEDSIADLEQVSKGLVSHYVVHVRDFGLLGRNVTWLKSNEARRAYRQRQKGKVARKPTNEWAGSDSQSLGSINSILSRYDPTN